jgi:hypothetical protein
MYHCINWQCLRCIQVRGYVIAFGLESSVSRQLTGGERRRKKCGLGALEQGLCLGYDLIHSVNESTLCILSP